MTATPQPPKSDASVTVAPLLCVAAVLPEAPLVHPVKSFDDLPLGIHKIICHRKDSSYSFGQESGMSRGVVRVAFRSNKTDQLLNGLDLIMVLPSSLK